MDTSSSVSRAIRDVKNQKFTYKKKRLSLYDNDDFDDKYNDFFQSATTSSGLGISHNPVPEVGFVQSSGTNRSSGFVSAKKILCNYEVSA